MKIRTSSSGWLLWVLIVLPYLALAVAAGWYFNRLKAVEQASIVVINKADMTLSQYDYKGGLLMKEKIATGKVAGNKKTRGDFKTPEGIFSVVSIEDASTWKHDFADDTLGEIKGAYGPYFIRLNVPGQKGIGIHGTHDNNSLGTRASEGCIRMNNGALAHLVKTITTSTVVVVTPGIEDIHMNRIDTSAGQLATKSSSPAPSKPTRKKEILKKREI